MPEELADRLAGLCFVAILRSQATTFRLTDLVGKELSCFNGAARLYWPGLSPKSDPWQHPLYLSGTIKRLKQTASGFHGEVMVEISDALTLRYVSGPVTRQVSAAFAKARRDEIEDLKHRYDKGLTDFKQFEGVLRLVEEERDAYKEELEKAKNRADYLLSSLEAKTQEVEEMKKNWSDFEEFQRSATEATVAPPEEDMSEGLFSNVGDAVRAARDEFHDNLDILDSALESAVECPFRNYGRVYQVLKAANEVGESWRKSLELKSSMGGGLVEAFRLKGVDFKKDISQTCRTKYGDDYKFMYRGERQMFAQHITEGSGNPNSCFSVHMLFDPDVQKVVIAYVGIHRRNTST